MPIADLVGEDLRNKDAATKLWSEIRNDDCYNEYQYVAFLPDPLRDSSLILPVLYSYSATVASI